MIKVENKRNYEVLKEVISPDNVLVMAELLAIRETKYLSTVMGRDLLEFHHNLYRDLKHSNNIKHQFSDGYDLVQEGALFLCQNYGKKLNDIVSYNKKGKPITIRSLCIKNMVKLVNSKYAKVRRTFDIDNLPLDLQPTTEIEEENLQDYTIFDEMIKTMNLTETHKLVLNCRMAGLSFPEIAKILNKCSGTIYDLHCTIKRRYIKHYEK